MFFGLIKKSTKNKTVVFGREINTDTKNKILSLKRGRIFTFDKEAFKNYAQRHPIVIGYGAVALIAVVMLISSTTSKATLAYFYPTSCLGGWEYPANAEGEPSLPVDAKRSEYNEDNSARLRGNSEIYCGSFEGQIPETAQATNFKVAFHISIDDGSVEHIKEEAKKIIDGEDLNMDSSDTDAESPNLEESAVDGESVEDNSDSQNDLSSQVEDTSVGGEETVDESQSNEPEPEPEQTESPSSESVGIFKLFTQTVFAEGEDAPQSSEEVQVSNDVEIQSEETESSVIEDNVESTDVAEEDTELVESENNDTLSQEADVNPDTENDTASSVPADAVLEAFYSLDGADWISFGYIRMNDWEEARYDIPLSEWNDLSVVQVKLEPLSSFDQSPVVYLDSVVIEVEYAGTEEDVLAQPDFRTDTILIDTVVEDIRVIKILRDGVPMIWYTKLPPPPEVVEVVEIPEIISIEGTESPSEQVGENNTEASDVPPENIPMTNYEGTNVTDPTQVTPESLEVNDISEPITFIEKVKDIFELQFAFAEGESSGDSGGQSTDSGGSTSGDSTSEGGDSSSENTSESSSTSSEVLSVDSNEISDTDVVEESNSQDSTTNNDNNSEDGIFDSISIPGSEGIVVDNVVRDNIESLPDIEDINITTTEEIVPGVIEIYYSEEQIQDEIAKNLEWNFVASGDVVDIATPIDISGGKIFWFSRDKTALNEYNTNSGSISSLTVSPEKEAEIKYLEPNGDVSEITIDPLDLEITTPKEDELGVQNSTVPDFENNDTTKFDKGQTNSESEITNEI